MISAGCPPNPSTLQPLTPDLILSLSREPSVSEFATGWFLPAAGAGVVQTHPSVRRGGTPGRRRHTSMTPWALAAVPAVRIGAGAWHLCQACVQAATPVVQAHATNFGTTPPRRRGKELL